MADNEHHEELLQCLLRHLDGGLVVDRQIGEFAESAYGLDAADLKEVLRDVEHDAHEPLLHLIFSPSEQLRRDVEVFLCAADIDKVGVAALAERLDQCRESVPISVADAAITVDLPFDRVPVRQLLNRLALDRQLDDRLCTALQETLGDDQLLAARTLLRRSKVRLSTSASELFCTLVRWSGARLERFGALFELLVTLAGGKPAGIDLEHYLFEKRRHTLKTLHEVEAFARKSEQYGLELLLMQRYPVPPDSEEMVCRELALLDELIFDALRLEPPPGEPQRQSEYGRFDVDADLERLLRTLS
ncbi:hypothetical protein [Desulfofustis glycolicus]|uniref:Uncharacterized protein n=1 Tax=Desulfofustis glycolicus DSM 9705 TaxID=1121409 RepID=A0A1M5SK95_9BACT|nr:hypothetical protein [Desulfofustis glycolicus]MCB2215670.1 hypothetical protein [Desulfobulbaceae bacterium]SHH39017.1 hypothetical protein SAMN02745124_00403 [Desulfofustis glycolicus DSM 9705]